MPQLYSEILLDHYRNPRNKGRLAEPDITHEEFNPLCGDRIRMEIALRGDVITDARFQGDGCAISIAAASMLTEMIVGLKIDDEIVSNSDLVSALESEIPPARLKCALLPLEALRAGTQKTTQ